MTVRSRHVLVAVAAALWAIFAVGTLAVNVRDGRPSHTACQEDAPCWNWRTMGNGQRGVVLATSDHRRAVVDAFTFDNLARACSIDWRATPHLRGDTP